MPINRDFPVWHFLTEAISMAGFHHVLVSPGFPCCRIWLCGASAFPGGELICGAIGFSMAVQVSDVFGSLRVD